MTYHLIHRLVDPLCEFTPGFHSAVAALFHCLGGVVSVHVMCMDICIYDMNIEMDMYVYYVSEYERWDGKCGLVFL